MIILLGWVQVVHHHVAQYLIGWLLKDGVVVIHIYNAQKHRKLSYPRRSTMVLSPNCEIQPLYLLKIHCLVGYNLA